MQRVPVRSLFLFAVLASVPFGFASAGPEDGDGSRPPGVVVHNDAFVADTATTITVWGHVIKQSDYTYSLVVELDGAELEEGSDIVTTATITYPNANVDDIRFEIDVSNVTLEEDAVLDYYFETDDETYTDAGSAAVYAE